MKIYIESDVINSPDEDIYRLLDIFFNHFWEERHLWTIDDIDKIMESAWFRFYEGSKAYKKKCNDLEEIYTKQIYNPKNSRMHSVIIQITLSANGPLNFTPDEAKCYLDEPLHVIVENAESDKAFIKAMICAFDRKEMHKALSNGWWKIEHAGGFGEITKRAKETLENFPKLPRIFILADSDREYPEDKTKIIKKIEDYCIKNRVPFHILNKRKIENYLPNEILENIPDKCESIDEYKELFQVFLNFSPEQRDFYEMKYGFKKRDNNGHRIVPENQKDLFSKLKQEEIDKLAGFGKKIWEYFKIYHGQIKSENIKEICQSDPDEIEDILNCIEYLI